jgi:hypothetical protein
MKPLSKSFFSKAASRLDVESGGSSHWGLGVRGWGLVRNLEQELKKRLSFTNP